MKLVKELYETHFEFDIGEDPELIKEISRNKGVAIHVLLQNGFKLEGENPYEKNGFIIAYHGIDKNIAEISSYDEVRSKLKKAIQKFLEVVDLLEN